MLNCEDIENFILKTEIGEAELIKVALVGMGFGPTQAQNLT